MRKYLLKEIFIINVWNNYLIYVKKRIYWKIVDIRAFKSEDFFGSKKIDKHRK